MKNIRGLLALLLVFVMFAQIGILGVSAVTLDANKQPTKYSDTYNSGTRFVIATTLNGTGAADYYKNNYTYDTLSKQSSNTLLKSLRDLMTNTHKKNSSYDDCWEYGDNADCQNEDGKVYLLYTNAQSSYANKNTDWNREHVWPKSLGGYETSGPGADLHHIRPSDNRVNSCRNNLKFGNVVGNAKDATGANGGAGISGGTYNSSYFEPLDSVKGDVARICLYMYARYGGSWSKCSEITNVFQSVDVLLEWCALDPVDTWELGRNEVVEAYQGNRNVFIDYPELAWKLFNREAPANMPSPSKGNPGGVTSPTTKPSEPTEAPTTAPTTPSVDPSVTGSATISFDNKAYRVTFNNEQQVWQQNGITVTNDKASSTINVADYYNPARFYANSKLTIAASNMKQVVFKCNSGSYAGALKSSIPNGSGYSVSISGSEVTVTFEDAVNSFIVAKLGAQVRVDSITIACEITTPDNPGTDNPGTDNPGTDNPGTDNPGTDNPGTDTPGTDNPGTDNPGTDNPGTDNPGTDNPGTDNPSTDNSQKEPTGFMAWLLGIINAILAIFGLKMVI